MCRPKATFNRVPLSGLSGSVKRVPSLHCRTSRTVAHGRAYTLVEVLLVAALLVVVAAIAAPVLLGANDRRRSPPSG